MTTHKPNSRAPEVTLEDGVWQILGTGDCRDGLVTCHLASTTRFRQQRNQVAPVQEMRELGAETVEAACGRPRGFYSWNRSLRGAFERGVLAAEKGGSPGDCPYRDKRKQDGRLTWSRAYQTAWLDGFAYRAARLT